MERRVQKIDVTLRLNVQEQCGRSSSNKKKTEVTGQNVMHILPLAAHTDNLGPEL